MASTETRRQSILEAAIRVIGRQGYAETSVGDVIEEAKTSRTTFYKHFDDKQECFLATHDLAMERISAELQAGCDDGGPWPERMRAGLAALVELLAGEPELARTAVVEVRAAGAEARRRHWDAVGRLSGFLEEGRQLAAGRELPDNTALMAAGAVAGLIFEELLNGGAKGLPALFPDLVFAMLVPYLGPSGATQEMRKAAASTRPS